MPIYLWMRHEPCPPEEIEKFEEARNIRLPRLLRDFLLKHDGGEANELQSAIDTRDPSCPISDLLPIRLIGITLHDDDGLTIPDVCEELRELIPRSGIPFAVDAFGGYLLADSETEEVDFVNLDPSANNIGVGCFSTGLKLQEIIGEIRDGER